MIHMCQNTVPKRQNYTKNHSNVGNTSWRTRGKSENKCQCISWTDSREALPSINISPIRGKKMLESCQLQATIYGQLESEKGKKWKQHWKEEYLNNGQKVPNPMNTYKPTDPRNPMKSKHREQWKSHVHHCQTAQNLQKPAESTRREKKLTGEDKVTSASSFDPDYRWIASSSIRGSLSTALQGGYHLCFVVQRPSNWLAYRPPASHPRMGSPPESKAELPWVWKKTTTSVSLKRHWLWDPIQIWRTCSLLLCHAQDQTLQRSLP